MIPDPTLHIHSRTHHILEAKPSDASIFTNSSGTKLKGGVHITTESTIGDIYTLDDLPDAYSPNRQSAVNEEVLTPYTNAGLIQPGKVPVDNAEWDQDLEAGRKDIKNENSPYAH